jgi:hypothetical protein
MVAAAERKVLTLSLDAFEQTASDVVATTCFVLLHVDQKRHAPAADSPFLRYNGHVLFPKRQQKRESQK